MIFNFTQVIPQDLNNQEPILISGLDTLELDGIEYLVIDNNEKILFEIRYEYHCSPFKQANIIDTILAVGYEENFYLFDLSTKTNILRLKMEGYFGHLYLDNDNFLVADARGLYCIDKFSIIVWKNNNLGIDGVIINDFVDNTILGSGEWNPPGGWRDFTLDRQTGNLIE